MKKLLITKFLLTTILIILITSCRGSGEESNTKINDSTHTTETESCTIDNDSLKIIKNQINQIIQTEVSIQEGINSLNNQQQSFKTQKNFIWIIIIFGIIISVIIILYILSIIISLRRQADTQDNAIKELKENIKKISLCIDKLNTDVKHLERKISDVEYRNRVNYNNIRPQPFKAEPKLQQDQNINSVQTERGYFGAPVNDSNPYFTTFYKIKESDVYFTVEKSGNTAKFRPFEDRQYLNSYLSLDTLIVAIEFDGGDPKTARSMTSIQDGETEFRDDRWYITKKAQVKLS